MRGKTAAQMACAGVPAGHGKRGDRTRPTGDSLQVVQSERLLVRIKLRVSHDHPLFVLILCDVRAYRGDGRGPTYRSA